MNVAIRTVAFYRAVFRGEALFVVEGIALMSSRFPPAFMSEEGWSVEGVEVC